MKISYLLQWNILWTHDFGYIILSEGYTMFNFSFIVYLYGLKFYAKTNNPLIDTFYMNPGYFLIICS